MKHDLAFMGVESSMFALPNKKYAVGVCKQSLKTLLDQYAGMQYRQEIIDTAIEEARGLRAKGKDPSKILSLALIKYAEEE